MRRYWIYVLANRTRVLYVGVTDDLRRRVTEHRLGIYARAFTRRYNVHNLVYFETFANPEIASEREAQLKGLSRAKKIRLIELKNPNWADLFDSLPPE